MIEEIIEGMIEGQEIMTGFPICLTKIGEWISETIVEWIEEMTEITEGPLIIIDEMTEETIGEWTEEAIEVTIEGTIEEAVSITTIEIAINAVNLDI